MTPQIGCQGLIGFYICYYSGLIKSVIQIRSLLPILVRIHRDPLRSFAVHRLFPGSFVVLLRCLRCPLRCLGAPPRSFAVLCGHLPSFAVFRISFAVLHGPFAMFLGSFAVFQSSLAVLCGPLRSFVVFSITPQGRTASASRAAVVKCGRIYDCMTVMTQKLVISMKHRSHHLTLS